MATKIRKSICLFLVAVCTFCCCFAVACQHSKKIVINYAGSYSNALALIMKEKGIAKKYFEGYKVEWTYMAASPDIRDAVLANRVSFGGLSIPSYLQAEEKGLKMDPICFAGDTPIKIYMRKDAGRGYNDLNSSDRIALVGLNTILHIAFLADAYNTFGSTSQFDSSYVVMPHADGLSLIASSNEISAYITTFPTTIKADSNINLMCVRDFTDTVKEYGIGSITVTSPAVGLEERKLFIDAMNESQKYIMDNPLEAAEIMSKDWGIDTDDILEVLAEMPPRVELGDYTKLSNLLHEIGYLK